MKIRKLLEAFRNVFSRPNEVIEEALVPSRTRVGDIIEAEDSDIPNTAKADGVTAARAEIWYHTKTKTYSIFVSYYKAGELMLSGTETISWLPPGFEPNHHDLQRLGLSAIHNTYKRESWRFLKRQARAFIL